MRAKGREDARRSERVKVVDCNEDGARWKVHRALGRAGNTEQRGGGSRRNEERRKRDAQRQEVTLSETDGDALRHEHERRREKAIKKQDTGRRRMSGRPKKEEPRGPTRETVR